MLWIIVATVLSTGLVVVIGMNFLTPEKRLERKVEHTYDLADPQFAREMGVILGPAIVGGNRVTALHNGDAIFPAMLEAIAAAQRSVTFETFVYWSGDVGRAFADAFIKRAEAGVPVHVTVDWVGSLKMEDDLVPTERYTLKQWQQRPWRERVAELVLVPLTSQL